MALLHDHARPHQILAVLQSMQMPLCTTIMPADIQGQHEPDMGLLLCIKQILRSRLIKIGAMLSKRLALLCAALEVVSVIRWWPSQREGHHLNSRAS